jgi:hypothetical protein
MLFADIELISLLPFQKTKNNQSFCAKTVTPYNIGTAGKTNSNWCATSKSALPH